MATDNAPKSATEKLRALQDRRAAIDERMKRLENQLAAKTRKEDTRVKVLIGAAFLADAQKHPNLIQLIAVTLGRAITNPKDRAFLTEKNLL
jgi:hypothetical protein